MLNFIRQFYQQPSGKRFQFAHRYLYKKFGQHVITKFILILISITAFLIGFLLLFLPGPGILFLVISLALLAIISLTIAKNLDRLETLLIKKFRKHRHDKKN